MSSTHAEPPQTFQDARDARVEELARPPLADATRRSYSASTKGFVLWLEREGYAPTESQPIHVVRYLAHLEARGLRAMSIRKVVAGISGWHRMHSVYDPTDHPMVRAGVENLLRTHGREPINRRRPITTDELRALLRACPDDLAGKRDAAACLTLFATGVRRSELVALDVADLEWVEGRGILVRIRRSKGDQLGSGQTVAVKYGVDLVTCPVRRLRSWMAAAAIQEGAVFRGVSRSGRVLERLGKSTVNYLVQQWFARAELPAERVGSHSFRRGVATALAQGGARIEQVATHLRHSSVDMSRQYIERANIWDAVPTELLGL